MERVVIQIFVFRMMLNLKLWKEMEINNPIFIFKDNFFISSIFPYNGYKGLFTIPHPMDAGCNSVK